MGCCSPKSSARESWLFTSWADVENWLCSQKDQHPLLRLLLAVLGDGCPLLSPCRLPLRGSSLDDRGSHALKGVPDEWEAVLGQGLTDLPVRTT